MKCKIFFKTMENVVINMNILKNYKKEFKKKEWCFLRTGHTKFGPERRFGLAKKLFKKSDVENFD